MGSSLTASRIDCLTKNLDLSQKGLEISPLCRPTILKQEANIYYVDVCSKEDSAIKHGNYEHAEIMELDWVWTPGSSLIEIIGQNDFGYCIEPHVLEHVPDPIGWLNQLFDILKTDGLISLALPIKEYCFDRFRRVSHVSQLIDAWLRRCQVPSTISLYDFLRYSVNSGYNPDSPEELAESFSEDSTSYSPKQALDYCIHSFAHGQYIDSHCYVFAPDSFTKMIEELCELGILNSSVTDINVRGNEFIVQLKKNGVPRIQHPGLGNPISYGSDVFKLSAELQHYKKAYSEAIECQDSLKAKITSLKAKRKELKLAIKTASKTVPSTSTWWQAI